jgi:phosphoglycerate kinase
MPKRTVRDVDVRGRRVLVRVDFNVPLDNGAVGDETRIRAALPTIQHLSDAGAIVILCSHLGRPKGKPDSKFSLAPVAERLAQLLHRPVRAASDCVGDDVAAQVAAMQPGDVLVLENLRFHAGEEANDPGFARQLASLADVYINDAFGSAHRAHASTAGVAELVPAAAGLLMEKELRFLGEALAEPARPFVAILGGAKVSDKIAVIERLLEKVDSLLIGGGMANTFLKAQGKEIGTSLVEEEKLDMARTLLARGGSKLIIPIDVVVADRFEPDAAHRTVDVDAVPPDWKILDIGPQTIDLFGAQLRGARTVVWNGPMGVFEMEPFAVGTFAVARILAALEGATTIIGGGDSAAAIEKAGMTDRVTHVSTGGGASLEFLEGKELPGVAVLPEQ